MGNLGLIGEEELYGEKVYHLSGFLASDAGGLLNSVPGAFVEMTPMGEVAVEVEFWIGVGDFLVRRTIQNIDIELSSNTSESGDLNLELDMGLSDYGEPVDILVPECTLGPGYSETQAATPMPVHSNTPVPAIPIPPTPEDTPTFSPTPRQEAIPPPIVIDRDSQYSVLSTWRRTRLQRRDRTVRRKSAYHLQQLHIPGPGRGSTTV